MFKLLIKILLLFSFFVIINVGTLFYFNNYEIYYPPFKKKFKSFIHLENYQNFMLGDSRVESGIVPSLFSKKTVNLGLPGIGSYVGLKALMLEGIDLKNKNVIISIGVLNLNDNRIHKRFLALFDDYLFQNIPFIIRSWGTKSIEHINAVYACKFFSCPYFNNLSQQYPLDQRGYLAKNEVILDPVKSEKAFLDRFYIYYKDFYVQGELYKAFQKSVTILKDRGANVFIVMFPNAPNYRSLLSKQGREEDFNRLIESVTSFAKREKVHFINYVDRFDLFDYPDFADIMHLNDQGARKFSTILNQEILKR